MPDHASGVVLVVKSETLHDLAQETGASVMMMPSGADDEAPIDMAMICVDDVEARQMATELRDRGVPERSVYWIDRSIASEGVADMVRRFSARQIHAFAGILYEAEDEVVRLSDIDDAPEAYYQIGVPAIDRHARFRETGELIVAVGPYGSGKSTLTQWIACRLLLAGFGDSAECPLWLNTLEDNPKQQKKQVARMFPPDDVRAAEMHSRILVTRPRWEGERTFDWWERRARYLNGRFGTSIFIIDPWSEMDHDINHRRETETQYVGSTLRRVRSFVTELGAIVFIVTHAQKSSYAREGTIFPMRLVHALGSGHFGGKADRGLCIQRVQGFIDGRGDHTIVHFDKIKIEGAEDMGVKGTVGLSFHPQDFSFTEAPLASQKAADIYAGREVRDDF